MLKKNHFFLGQASLFTFIFIVFIAAFSVANANEIEYFSEEDIRNLYDEDSIHYLYGEDDIQNFYEEDELDHVEQFFYDEYAEDTPTDPRARTARNGWVDSGGFRFFYVNGVRQRTWRQISGRWYFFNPPAGTSGHLASGPVGAMRVGWLQRGTNWYFLNPRAGNEGHSASLPFGAMHTGWLAHNNNWYFLNPPTGGSGHNSSRPEGVMLTGWVQRGSNRYFLNPQQGTTNHQSGLPWGAMLTGRRRISNNWYLFNRSGMSQGRFNESRHMTEWVRPVFSGNTRITINISALNQTWRTPVVTGTAVWNDLTLPVRFSTTTSATANNPVRVVDRVIGNADALGGYIITQQSGSDVRNFTIELSSRNINNYVSTQNANFINVVTSVMAHELGHAMGLQDNPLSSRNGSLMNHNRQRNVRIRPADYDADSVRMIYR